MNGRSANTPPLWLIVAALALTALAPPGWVTVQATEQSPVLAGFASVQPGTPLTITAMQSGVLTRLSVMPGESVQRGEAIGQLGGPQLEAALATAEGANRAASATLAAERGKFADHLSTRAAVAQAEAAAEAAGSDLAALRATLTLRSPAAGQVKTLSAGLGDALRLGQEVAVLQPASGAWVKVALYGPQAATLAPGMIARFIPGDGAAAVSVTLRGVQGTQPDGGLMVAFSGKDLQPGEAGTLRLALPRRPVLLVPSEALVLDDGRWWVMLHDAHGDHAMQVVPGATEGARTAILSGLVSGDQVIVQDAALLYHRGIASQYQPPD